MDTNTPPSTSPPGLPPVVPPISPTRPHRLSSSPVRFKQSRRRDEDDDDRYRADTPASFRAGHGRMPDYMDRSPMSPEERRGRERMRSAGRRVEYDDDDGASGDDQERHRPARSPDTESEYAAENEDLNQGLHGRQDHDHGIGKGKDDDEEEADHDARVPAAAMHAAYGSGHMSPLLQGKSAPLPPQQLSVNTHRVESSKGSTEMRQRKGHGNVGTGTSPDSKRTNTSAVKAKAGTGTSPAGLSPESPNAEKGRSMSQSQNNGEDEAPPEKQARPKMTVARMMYRTLRLVISRGADYGEQRIPGNEKMPPEVEQGDNIKREGSLWNAASTGDLKKFCELIEKNKDKYREDNKPPRNPDILYMTGPEGETLLHIAILFDQENIINYLIDVKPGLINAVYEGNNFNGEHPCHILAVNNKLEMLKKFVKLGADVHNPRAFGETILAFAACMGHLMIVKFLVEKANVDPNMKDHHGNNVLHVLAYWGYYNDTRARNPDREEYKKSYKHSQIGGIYKYLLDAGADPTAANVAGMTPLQVAVYKAHTAMVSALLESDNYRELVWKWGTASCYLYDLSEIDTYVDHKTMNHKRGALAIAIRKKNREILNLPLFQRLLEAKWVSYAKRMYLFAFLASFLYMCVFTVMILLLPNGAEFYDLRTSSGPSNVTLPARNRLNYFNATTTVTDNVRLVVEAILVVCNVWTLIAEIQSLIELKVDYFKGTGLTENVVQWTNMTVFICAVFTRLAGDSDAENALLGMHAVTGWVWLLTFTKGLKNTGTLVLIFYKILTGDLVRFLFLISLFILGFGQALWLQMAPYASYYVATNGNGTKDDTFYDVNDWNRLATGFLWGFRFMLQQGVYNEYRDTNNSGIAITLYMILFFLLNVLLLNVLIAMLNQTFSSIIGDTEKQWRMIWAELIYYNDLAILSNTSRKPEEMPVSRIGFPLEKMHLVPVTRLKGTLERKEAHKLGITWSPKGWWLKSKEPEKPAKELRKYFRYCMMFEFRDGIDFPTRTIASADPLSPLSGKFSQHNVFSTVSWDVSLLKKKEDDDTSTKLQRRKGRTRSASRGWRKK
ncbi:hypothetical protein HK101_000875 [Irineochytrium annulatum]|nr:hypothetical protein HK101_000875 [Irineochytrium annulatum]